MTYTEQVEAQVVAYQETATADIPAQYGVTALPAYPHVEVHSCDQDYCELRDADARIIARFRLVG